MSSTSKIKSIAVTAMALIGLAVPAYSESKDAIPKDGNSEMAILLKRGYGQICVGMYNPAIETLTKAIRLNGGNLTARRFLTYALLQVGQVTEALDHLKILTQAPHPEAMDYYLLGEAHLQIGWIDAANADFTKALELKPDMQSAKVGLIKVMVCNSDFDNAIKICNECLTAAMNLNPPNRKLTDYFKHLLAAIKMAQTQNNNDLPGSVQPPPDVVREFAGA